jgi:hypothetical protein
MIRDFIAGDMEYLSMKKPNLFIVGHPRTGTSSLHDYLNQHPDIFMSPIKEPNYFAKDFHEESDRFHHKALYFPFRTEKRYLKLYKNWEHEKIAGEASATSLYSKMSAKEIYKLNQNAKIIMSFREPVEFLYSYHSTAIFSLGEDVKDFRRALSMEPERKKGHCLSKRVITPSWLYYSQFIDYSKQLNRFSSLFGKDQIKVLIFNDFKMDTKNTYREILRFLDVDPSFVPDFAVVNPYKKSVKWPGLKYVLFDSPYFRKIQHLIFPDTVYARLVQFYKKMILIAEPKNRLDAQLKKELMLKFKIEVQKLSDVLQRDLITLWGYNKI